MILGQNYSSNNNVLMYVQIIGVVIFMIGFIIYSMFIHNKLIISKDALIYKGLFLNRKLKFNEIKGFKIVYTAFSKRYKHIIIIPNSNTQKNIIIRPTSKTSFIELTDWIEKNIKKIEKGEK